MIQETHYSASYLASLSEEQRQLLIRSLNPADADALLYDWKLWARANQLAPKGDWSTWMIMSGRGWGKTRTGAEWIRERVQAGYRRIGLIAKTPADARDIMIEGESGILACIPKDQRPTYETTKRRLTWKNGAVALAFSSHEPDHLRGVQFDTVWVDELATYEYARETWETMRFALRLSDDPRCLVTTTPKPMAIIKEIIKEEGTVLTTGSSYDNQANLTPQFFEQILSRYENTRIGRQEIHAELLDEAEGSLWKRDWIENTRVGECPNLLRIVVALDPAVTKNKESDETGIVVCGIDDKNELYVLDDSSGRYTPQQWGGEAIALYKRWMADRIVAETNNGGMMVESVLRQIDESIPYKSVHASKGKRVRAEPISALYEQGKVHHVGRHNDLEDQLCNWDPMSNDSPDRLDALVWACTELIGVGSPQIRWL